MTGDAANDDLKAKMREALEKKNAATHGGGNGASAKEKTHGSEVLGAARRLHRRKSGG